MMSSKSLQKKKLFNTSSDKSRKTPKKNQNSLAVDDKSAEKPSLKK